MDALKWRQVKDIFSAALEHPPGKVDSFLDEACGSDLELRAEVSRLLREHADTDDFLEAPLISRERYSAPAPRDPIQPFQNDRFLLRQKLGAGGFGEVYEALDRQRNGPVAVKYLRNFDPEQLYRLKTEFRTLTGLRHPNLVQVYELFSASDPAFFTMELLSGQSFASYFRKNSGFSKLRDYMVQLARGVIALHEAGLLHRDIKPSNIFITAEERTVLLDFGLVKQLAGLDSKASIALLGTPAYLAPEQLQGKALTEATDWYAFGVVLYEALTSRKPFEGSVLELLSRNRAALPEEPAAQGVPADLSALCMQLLQVEPAARPTGYEVLRALENSVAPVMPRSGWGVFVSRQAELATLQKAFGESEQGAAVCVHVRGASGAGKSATIRQFLEQIHESAPNCAVLNGRCYESESAPHRGLDELVDRLARFLRGLDRAVAQALIPRHFSLLAKLFPVLREFEPLGRKLAETPDPREQRRRAFAALRECLGRIAETHSLILWIDDLQWGDLETARALNDLLQAADPLPCLMILSYRESEQRANPVLRALEHRSATHVLDITELNYEDAKELAAAMLQSAGAEDWRATAEMVARESGGNPYYVSELVRYGIIPLGGAHWGTGSDGLGDIIRRRIAVLSKPALRLLELVAVAGQPVASEVCVRAAGFEQGYFATRDLLIREHLLRTVAGNASEELDLYHDQIRAAILEQHSAEMLRADHGLLARALEESGSDDQERLAIHYEGCGELAKATERMLKAAAQAANSLGFERAARLYGWILETGSPEYFDRQTVLEQWGEALANAGRGKEAAEALLAASEGCEVYACLDLRRRACEQYLRSGHLEEGMRLARTLTKDVGLYYPDGNWMVPAALLWSRLRLKWQLRRPLDIRRESLTKAAEAKADVCWTVALGMGMVDVVRSAYFQSRYTQLALKSGEPSRMARGVAAELAMGAIHGQRPQKQTDRLFQSALQLAEQVGSDFAFAFVHSMRGAASRLCGDYQDCYDRNVPAADIYREKCSGVGWELTTAMGFALSSLVFLGRWKEHASSLSGLAQQAEARGDRYGAVSLPILAYAYVDYLAADQSERAREVILEALSGWSDEEFHLQHSDALCGQIEICLYEENPEQAQALLTAQWPRMLRSNLLKVSFQRIFTTALRARIALALVASGKGDARTQLKIARRGATILRQQNLRWGKALGYLLEAGIATVEGNRESGLEHLLTAEMFAALVGMQHYVAAAQIRRQQMEGKAAEANAWMVEQGIQNPARVLSMLAPGRWGPG